MTNSVVGLMIPDVSYTTFPLIYMTFMHNLKINSVS